MLARGNSGLRRQGVYDIKTVLDWVEADSNVDTDHEIKNFKGFDVLSGLLGYKVFKHKGIKCPCCPIQGEYFALEKTPGNGKSKYNNWHFNLYGTDAFGREVMITKDHITPRSKGGPNELKNLQPMCMVCNTKKGSLHMKEFEAKEKGKIYDWNLDHANHVIKRLSERYSLEMTIPEYADFRDNVMLNSETVHIISNSKSYRKIRFKGTDVYAVYSSIYHTVYTVLDPNEIEERKRDVPNWGNGREKECLAEYDRISELIKSQYKEFPTQQETIEHFKTCEYSSLMFTIWKKKMSRLNVVIWNMVKDSFKIKETPKFGDIPALSELKNKIENENRTEKNGVRA